MAEDQSREHNEQQKVQRAEPTTAGPESLLAPENAPLYPTSLLNDPRLSGRGNGPVRTALMLQMQRTYGNRATGRFLQSQRVENTPALGLPLQRQPHGRGGEHTPQSNDHGPPTQPGLSAALRHMIAAGTNYPAVRTSIRAAPAEQRTAVLRDRT